LFNEMTDWSTLRHVAPVREPFLAPNAFRVTDASLSVDERKLELFWRGNTAGATSARVSVETNGTWVIIASGTIGEEENRIVLDVPQLVETDQCKLSSLKSTYVRVELLDARDAIIASSIAPMNVDCPQQFCGTVLVGSAMSALDEQIALAGCGIPQTYRQQLDFIERRRSRELEGETAPAVLTHQADLDRFFRNLQTGFRGIRTRLRTRPDSEFTARRILRDLARWCQDTVDLEDGRLSTECRLFLTDRLVRELRATLESCGKSRVLAQKVKPMAREFRLTEILDSTWEWLHSLRDPWVQPYIDGTKKLLESVSKQLKKEAEGR
jgi:hypothetical protein